MQQVSSSVRLRASAVVPTAGRVVELRRVLQSLVEQTVPLEVLVMDDTAGSEVSAMLSAEFRGVRHVRLASGRGPAFQRNRGIELATERIAFPVDDDSVFASPQTVEQTLAEFDDPRIAAVGIPYINVRQDGVVRQRAPAAGEAFAIHAFVGAAHAIRRDTFLELGGFREHFFYMGEEGDLCLRFLARGYVIRAGSADPIHHLESPKRDLARAGFHGRRNDVLFAWHNVPFPHLLSHLVGTTVKGIDAAIRIGPTGPMLRGIASGFRETLRRGTVRQPVSAMVYRLHRRLKLGGPLALKSIRSMLPNVVGS